MDDESERAESDGGVQPGVDEYIRTAQPPPAEVLELDFVFKALSHPRRRYIVYSLLSNTQWTLTELARKLVAWERDIREEAVTDHDRDRMYISLYHAHIPKLVDLEILKFEDDGDEEIIVADEHAVQVLAVLEGAGASLDTTQETHARSDYEHTQLRPKDTDG